MVHAVEVIAVTPLLLNLHITIALIFPAVPVTVDAEPEQEAIEGGNAELLCTATSSPPPTITWFRIETGGETQLERRDSDDPNFGNLSIPNVDRSQAGQYRCEGRYIFGAVSILIDLIVLSKCYLCCCMS